MLSRVESKIGAIFLLSGGVGLAYEVLWMRSLILVFGSTLLATGIILTVFMGGLALGAWGAGRLGARVRTRPLVVYGLLEIGLGLYAMAVPWLMESLQPAYARLWTAFGEDSFIAFNLIKAIGIALVLMPPTTFMGASLPLLAREVTGADEQAGVKVGGLYAANTFGAVLGTFWAGIVAIPALGAGRTLTLTAAVSLVLGLAAILLARIDPRSPAARNPAQSGTRTQPDRPASRNGIGLVLGVSGFVALALEVLWTRALALVLGSSVYAFSLMLMAFLAGIAGGSLLMARLLRRHAGGDRFPLLAALLGGGGLLAYGTTFLLGALPRLFAWVHFTWSPTASAWLPIELLFALSIMLPATLTFGAIFPVALEMLATTRVPIERAVGRAYAANTLGAILGALLSSFALLPAFGVNQAIQLVAGLQIGQGLLIALSGPGYSARKLLRAAPLAAGLSMVILFHPTWNTLMMNSGVFVDIQHFRTWREFTDYSTTDTRVLYAKDGWVGTVVVEEDRRQRSIRINGKADASSRDDLETQLLCGYLPALLHPAARDALVVGIGSGATAGSLVRFPLRSIRVVEVEKAMVEAAAFFSDINHGLLDDPRVKVSINDARNELAFSPRQYDIIVSEPSNPWMTVASNLFTEEFFHLVRQRLRGDGVFAQWLQTYNLGSDDLRSILAAFRASYPYVLVFRSLDGYDLILTGSSRPLRFDLPGLGQLMRGVTGGDLPMMMIHQGGDLIGYFLLGERELEKLVEGAPRNTDDSARVEFSAPLSLRIRTEATRTLLEHSRGNPWNYLAAPPVPEDEQAVADAIARGFLLRGDRDSARRFGRPPTRPLATLPSERERTVDVEPALVVSPIPEPQPRRSRDSARLDSREP